MEKIYTVDDLADAFKVSTDTIYNLVKSGELPHFKVKKSIRFTLEHVKQYVQRTSVTPNPNPVTK